MNHADSVVLFRVSFIQIVLANPGSEIMKKLDSSKVLEQIGDEWIFPTVGEAVAVRLHDALAQAGHGQGQRRGP
jgi:hypothetical protein